MNQHRALFKFALVGSIGFIADASLFSTALYVCDLDVLLSRVIAFFGAACVTWLGNRWYTFAHSGNVSKFHQWAKFMISASISAIPNFIAFKLVISTLGENTMTVYIALAFGVLVGMLSNFILSSRWVFRSKLTS
ncbi:GtrA family protein [Vibrio sp. ZSDE26]|uniref:GtrA family protein n=1 Tax=Vibrio amylolyticus TaxID=2847292 RepID=A0A9X1XLX8_9VIBR|nr:GtrA family protein [Vibrio amylolyticus]MCK6264645.1 GtrA family protein [Vibrio amylolyticus]